MSTRKFNCSLLIAGTALILAICYAAPVQAVTTVAPGTTTTLNVHDDLTCETATEGPSSEDGIPVSASCRHADNGGTLGARHLEVYTFTGFSTQDLPSAQEASSVARLINEISIPAASPTGGSNVLSVQIATEVSWSGILLAAGINSTFAQVIATLQVRDKTTGEVVGSNTFLFERIDADFTLDVIDAIEGVDLTNSSGVDITALLACGRTSSIELEVKCHVSVPLLGAAVCTFYDMPFNIPGVQDLFANDGFDVDNITVTVASDPVEVLLGN